MLLNINTKTRYAEKRRTERSAAGVPPFGSSSSAPIKDAWPGSHRRQCCAAFASC